MANDLVISVLTVSRSKYSVILAQIISFKNKCNLTHAAHNARRSPKTSLKLVFNLSNLSSNIVLIESLNPGLLAVR